MTQALVVSVVALWILVLVLAGVVFALARQVGVLHERIAPAGALALSDGPKVGEAAPAVAAESLAGSIARIGEADPDGRGRLVFFVSPRCPVCKSLLPTVKRIAREGAVKLVIASDGPEEDHAGLAKEHDLALDDYYLSAELGVRYGIAKLPYAVLMDGDGIVRGQGIVNTREHVESLFEAERMRVGSIQDYLQRQRGGAAASVELPMQRNDA
ncbi:MAG: methylamine dehydrogenase accessory protein MauD [Myxococcota bacterium]